MAANADEGAVVLVQDYHLSLTGSMLAKARPDLRTVHFSHTPFADPNVLRVLPSAAAGELLAGMAGFGACGFHTARWEAAFRACSPTSSWPPSPAPPAAHHVRRPPRARPGGHQPRGRLAGQRRGRRGPRRAGRRTGG